MPNSIILFVFFGCSKDEATVNCDNQVLTGSFNGTPWVLESIKTATIFRGIDPVTGRKAYKFDLVANGKDGSTLNILVTEFEKGVSGECMDLSKTWSTVLFENYMDPVDFSTEIVIFTFKEKNGETYSTFLEELPGLFRFKSCDATNHKISGEFSFKVFDGNSEISFSSGKFENVCFKSI